MDVENVKQKINLHKLRAWYIKYERYLIPGALLLGFVVDIVTFRFINFSTALLLLSGHIILAGGSIAFIDFYESGKLRTRFYSTLRVFAPLVIQYSLGALLSASVIFYSFSGSIYASWPFILVLVFLMIANEFLKKYYINPVFQMSAFFFAVFSFTILAVPYFLRSLGPWVFILSGFAGLVFIFGFIYFLQARILEIKDKIKVVSLGVLAVFVLMNIFYFTNVIPPFPLSIRDIGVYHSVQRYQGGYLVVAEEKEWYEHILPYEKFHLTYSGDSAYVFSSVFSPARLDIEIIHEWQYFDADSSNWTTASVISFEIVGGRDEGYRGYSRKTNIFPGRWRVDVKTFSGQTIGRISFKVVETNEALNFVTEVK